jgi:hypothetical protein
MATKPEDDNGWLEPESAANEDTQPKYPYNKTIQTESGHLVELDDTPNRERIRVTHRTGTFIEMGPNGDEVHKVYGDGYEITIKDKNVLIEGTCSVTINGDSIINVKGDKIEKIEGDYKLEVNGEFVAYSHTKASLLSDEDVLVGAGTSTGLGQLQLAAGDSLYITGDLTVGGEIIGDIITSKTRVDAGTGVSAGPLGFVSVLGGISIGVPVATPGIINCIGLITAGVSMSSKLGSFGVMKATWMTDSINKALHNVHKHPSFKGPTGPPIPRMK